MIGKSAPWFVLAVMLFSYAVRSIYIESSSMFVRGGVYRVVKEAMGSNLAKLSVSALLFDYVLTGPISAVSAGQYLAGFVVDLSARYHHPLQMTDAQGNYFAAAFAVLVTLFFWWKNIQGIHESSGQALRIMQITTVMVILLIVWCLVTLIVHPAPLPPLPSKANITIDHESLGWLYHSWVANLTWVLLLVGFGHSVLAMSGEESLAQVNREIEHPKLKNLEKTGLVIFLYSLLFTSLVSFFAVMIIPDKVRPDYFANLISGLAMNVVGPYTLKLFFQGFVVLVGALILSGAVNTAIVGANGVLNRISEDGVMPTWFRKPHSKFGTSLPHHQPHRVPADLYHHRQSRQRLPAGLAVRIRSHLELRLQVAGSFGAAVHRTGESPVEGTRQPPHRQHRASDRARADFAAVVCHRRHKPVHQATGDDLRDCLQRVPFLCLYGLRADQPQDHEGPAA